MACNTFGSAPAASTSPAVPNLQNPLIACSAGTVIQLNAIPILKTSQAQLCKMAIDIAIHTRSYSLRKADGLHAGGPFKS
jgi:hypothetical protein